MEPAVSVVEPAVRSGEDLVVPAGGVGGRERLHGAAAEAGRGVQGDDGCGGVHRVSFHPGWWLYFIMRTGAGTPERVRNDH